MQKMADIDIPARIKTAGYASVLKPCLDSMREERKRILGTVGSLNKSLQEYRKITDESEYCSIYPRKRRYEEIDEDDEDAHLEYEEDEFGELVPKRRRRLDAEKEGESVEYEEVVQDVIDVDETQEKPVKLEAPNAVVPRKRAPEAEYESPMTYESSGEKASFPSSMDESGVGSSPREEAKADQEMEKEESDEELIDRAHELIDSDESVDDEVCFWKSNVMEGF